jgi:hypothetical protein
MPGTFFVVYPSTGATALRIYPGNDALSYYSFSTL